MPEKASLQQGKLLQPRNIPCGALAKNPNSSKIRSPGMQNTSQKNSPNITFLESIKNNNSVAREMPFQWSRHMALGNYLRKTRTASGCAPSLNITFGIHKKQQFYRPWDASPMISPHGLGKLLAKNPNSIRMRAPGMKNTSQKNSPNVTFGIHKKQH